MKTVTWILRILSTATFAYMCFIVYNQLRGYWDWNSPYVFIVTVYRILSLLLFYLVIIVAQGFEQLVGGGASSSLATALFNTIMLKFWYLQPYGGATPFTDIQQVFLYLNTQLGIIAMDLWDRTFTFLYFLFAGIGVAMFLQSLFRMEHKFVAGAFLSIQAIMIVAAFRGLPIYGQEPIATGFLGFLTSGLQILALVSFAYLEISYQMIYSYSVGKPVEDRQETLKKQLLALRAEVRKQDAIERGEKVAATSTSRLSGGATAFSFLREVIERKLLGSREALENLDAVSDIRRLNIYIDQLLASDPSARDELTARAAAPSSGYVIYSTVLGSIIRFLSVVALSYILVNPLILIELLNLPPGISYSVELQQPEMVVILLVPVLLLLAFIAAMIRWYSQWEEEALQRQIEAEEKRKAREKKREARRLRREARKRRKALERGPEEGEIDEWDRVLGELYQSEGSES